jgi:hypothetical protein
MLLLRGSSMHEPDIVDVNISTDQSEDKHVIVANNSSSGDTNTGAVTYIVNYYSSRSLAIFKEGHQADQRGVEGTRRPIQQVSEA